MEEYGAWGGDGVVIEISEGRRFVLHVVRRDPKWGGDLVFEARQQYKKADGGWYPSKNGISVSLEGHFGVVEDDDGTWEVPEAEMVLAAISEFYMEHFAA